jgi:hypothetical protein
VCMSVRAGGDVDGRHRERAMKSMTNDH